MPLDTSRQVTRILSLVLSGSVLVTSKATMSSALGDMQVSLAMEAVDGRLATCVRTALEHEPWLRLELSSRYVVTHIVLKKDFSSLGTVAYNCTSQGNSRSSTPKIVTGFIWISSIFQSEILIGGGLFEAFLP